jgi:hypothetical protein
MKPIKHPPLYSSVQRLLRFGLLGVWVLAGCGPAAPFVTPIPEEMIPTVIAQTAAAAQGGLSEVAESPLAAETDSEATDVLPTHQPTNSPEVEEQSTQAAAESPVVVTELIDTPVPADPLHPDLADIPEAEIKIFRPGPLSRVASPFRVVADLPPGPEPDFLVKVELIGEDGMVLVRKLVRVPLPTGTTRTTFVTDIEFEIRAVAEAGRILISTEDEFGRIKALASTPLILVADGESDLEVYQDTLENIIIQQPQPFRMIESAEGILLVTGLARQDGDSALLIELIDENGKVVGFGNAPYIVPEEGPYGLFVGEVKYIVAEPTWVRLQVKTQGERVPGFTHITTMEVVVSP